MLCSVHNAYLGGRVLTSYLSDHFANKFQEENKVDVRKNPKAWHRLVQETEKLKKNLSGDDPGEQTINIDSLVKDHDFTEQMDR